MTEYQAAQTIQNGPEDVSIQPMSRQKSVANRVNLSIGNSVYNQKEPLNEYNDASEGSKVVTIRKVPSQVAVLANGLLNDNSNYRLEKSMQQETVYVEEENEYVDDEEEEEVQEQEIFSPRIDVAPARQHVDLESEDFLDLVVQFFETASKEKLGPLVKQLNELTNVKLQGGLGVCFKCRNKHIGGLYDGFDESKQNIRDKSVQSIGQKGFDSIDTRQPLISTRVDIDESRNQSDFDRKAYTKFFKEQLKKIVGLESPISGVDIYNNSLGSVDKSSRDKSGRDLTKSNFKLEKALTKPITQEKQKRRTSFKVVEKQISKEKKSLPLGDITSRTQSQGLRVESLLNKMTKHPVVYDNLSKHKFSDTNLGSNAISGVNTA